MLSPPPAHTRRRRRGAHVFARRPARFGRVSPSPEKTPSTRCSERGQGGGARRGRQLRGGRASPRRVHGSNPPLLPSHTGTNAPGLHSGGGRTPTQAARRMSLRCWPATAHRRNLLGLSRCRHNIPSKWHDVAPPRSFPTTPPRAAAASKLRIAGRGRRARHPAPADAARRCRRGGGQVPR